MNSQHAHTNFGWKNSHTHIQTRTQHGYIFIFIYIYMRKQTANKYRTTSPQTHYNIHLICTNHFVLPIHHLIYPLFGHTLAQIIPFVSQKGHNNSFVYTFFVLFVLFFFAELSCDFNFSFIQTHLCWDKKSFARETTTTTTESLSTGWYDKFKTIQWN